MMILICLNCLNDSFLSIALLKLPWKRNEPENNPKRGLIFYQKFHGNESKKLKSESVRQIKLNKKKKKTKCMKTIYIYILFQIREAGAKRRKRGGGGGGRGGGSGNRGGPRHSR